MKTFYKIFLVLFVIFIGFNLYSIDWNIGFLAEENTKFIISLAAGVFGIILVLILDTWSRLATKK